MKIPAEAGLIKNAVHTANARGCWRLLNLTVIQVSQPALLTASHSLSENQIAYLRGACGIYFGIAPNLRGRRC